jgi:hypothetical protein
MSDRRCGRRDPVTGAPCTYPPAHSGWTRPGAAWHSWRTELEPSRAPAGDVAWMHAALEPERIQQ